MSTQTFHMGALFYRSFRKAIEYLRFRGYQVEVYEGPGWVSRDFVVKGDKAAIGYLQSMVTRWVE